MTVSKLATECKFTCYLDYSKCEIPSHTYTFLEVEPGLVQRLIILNELYVPWPRVRRWIFNWIIGWQVGIVRYRLMYRSWWPVI